ncbi:MAG: helix-turn-helix domain-containing protein [Methanomassiliicoccales archaeon]
MEREFICPIEATLSLIEGKWKPLIIWRLREKTMRFNQLASEMAGISPKMLTKQLRELELDGLIERKMFPEIPPRVEYSLSPKGRSLMPVLESMGAWGIKNMPDRLAPCDREACLCRELK